MFLQLLKLNSIVVIMMLLFTCVHYDNNNPYDPDYPAWKYQFHVNWLSIDTVYLKKEYKFPCTTSTGQDTFINFDKSKSVENLNCKVTFCAFDTFSIVFENEFKGTLTINAYQPNTHSFSESHEITVVNQFRPRINSLSDIYRTVNGTIDKFVIFVTDTVDSMFTVHSQREGSSQVDSTTIRHPLSMVSVPCTLSCNLQIDSINRLTLWIQNLEGLISDTVTLKVVVTENVPKINKIFFPNTIRYKDTLQFAINLDSSVSSFKTIAKYGDTNEYYDTSGVFFRTGNNTKVIIPPVKDTGRIPVEIRIFDVTRKTMSMPQSETLYVDPLLPVLLDSLSMQLPLNDSQQIDAVYSKNEADSFHWVMGRKGFDSYAIDTITKRPFIIVFFTNKFSDTLKVFGVNKFHFAGPIARIFLSAEELPYLLRINDTLFPSNIPARHQSRFEVVIDKASQFKGRNGSYFWRFDSLNILVDSFSGPQYSTYTRYFSDSSRFLISVIARDTLGDSSNRIKKYVTVHRYAPRCWFDKRVDTIFIPAPDTLKLRYADSNPDTNAKIDSVIWDLNDDGIFENRHGNDSILVVPNTIAGKVGSHVIRAFVKDKDGYSSLVDSTILIVNSALPYISEEIGDVGVLINTTRSIRAKFLVSGGQAPIMKYIWMINGNIQENETDVLTFSFNTVGVDTIVVYCVNTQFVRSPMDTVLVTVSSENKPIIKGITPDTVWIYNDTAYTMNCMNLMSDIPISQYYVSWDKDSLLMRYDTPSFKKKYSISGPHFLKMVVTDKNLQPSDTVKDTVWVRKASPVCDSIIPDTAKTNIFINKSHSYSMWAHDTNGIVDSIKIFWNSGPAEALKANQAAISKTTFSHTYSPTDVGRIQLRAIVKDNDGLWSDTLRDSIQVKRGSPIIQSIKKDSIIAINSHHIFKLNASDSAGTIDSFFISFNDGATYRATKDSICDTVFTSPGKLFIKAFVRNDRGIFSTTLRDSINVLSHNSSISVVRITIDKTSDNIFINDPIKFTVFGKDSLNRKITSVAFAWKGNLQFIDTVKNAGSDSNFIISHAFNISDTSTKGVRIRLTNDQGQERDSLIPISIRIGKPVVDSITPTTIWVNDDTTFVIASHDTNGAIDSFSINWGDGTPLSLKAKTDVIKHKYSISQSGAKQVKIVAFDDDDISSDTAKFTVNVRLGKPSVLKTANNDTMVWNDTLPGNGDTLTCPYSRSGTNMTAIVVGVGDSNGMVKKVYWDVNNGTYTYSSATTMWSTNSLTKDVCYQFKVWCMDDDSVISDTMRFYVLPHSPPPNLTGMNAENQKIYWSGKDPVDGDSTQYKLVFKRHVTGSDSIFTNDAINGCTECVIVPFKTGYDANHGSPSSEWMFQVNTVLKTSGSYYYKIYPRNSRGQISQSIGQPMFNY